MLYVLCYLYLNIYAFLEILRKIFLSNKLYIELKTVLLNVRRLHFKQYIHDFDSHCSMLRYMYNITTLFFCPALRKTREQNYERHVA